MAQPMMMRDVFGFGDIFHSDDEKSQKRTPDVITVLDDRCQNSLRQ